MKPIDDLLDTRFRLVIALTCLAYAVIEAVYVAGLPLSMDEFGGAANTYDLASQVPYRDFSPYKTVLGYYLELVPMLVTDDLWLQIVFVKWTLTLVNAALMFAAAMRLARHFRRSAVCYAVVMLVCMSTFLERSAAFRLDMLTAWFGLFSLLYLLDRRVIVAGVLAGLSVLVSQKGIYFVAAAGIAAGSHWALVARDRAGLRAAVWLGVGVLAPIAVYVALWSAIASPSALWEASYARHTEIAFTDIYSIREFWFQTILRNPLFYTVSVLALGMLFVRRQPGEEGFRDWVLMSYGGALIAMCVWHKQPWPYFFVLLIPTLTVLATSFFDTEVRRESGLSRPLLAAFLALAVVHPLWRVPTVLDRDNGFQRNTIALADAFLDDGDTYLAGIRLIATRHHAAFETMSWLDARRLKMLQRADHDDIVRQLDRERPKLVIWNYRMAQLPRRLARYVSERYTGLVGNILIYSPFVKAGAGQFEVWFGGNYRIRAVDGQNAAIDGQPVTNGALIYLDAGVHAAAGTSDLRLQFQPARLDQVVDPRYVRGRELFVNVYDY